MPPSLLVAFRNAVGSIPIGIGTNRGRLLLPLLDPFFGQFWDHPIQIDRLAVSVRPTSHEERVLAYFFHNVLHNYRKTPLFFLLQKLYNYNGGVFVDVGAHFGIYSLLARLIGYKTVLFEPERTCFDFITRNPCLGEGYQIALSDANGEKKFFIGRTLSASSLVPTRFGKTTYVDSYSVKTRKGGDFIQQVVNDIKSIIIIKIDVEGEEEKVVDGLQEMLQECDPVIWCEVRGERSDRNPGSCCRVAAILGRLGYSGYLFDGARCKPVTGEDERYRGVFDVLFSRTVPKLSM